MKQIDEIEKDIKKMEYIEPEEKVCEICGSPLENGCCLLCSLDEEEIELKLLDSDSEETEEF